MDEKYDDIFEIDGRNIYIVFPDGVRDEAYRWVINYFDLATKLGELDELEGFPSSMILPRRPTVDLFAKSLMSLIESMLDSMVVSWDLTDEEGRLAPCTTSEKISLKSSIKHQIASKLVDSMKIRLLLK